MQVGAPCIFLVANFLFSSNLMRYSKIITNGRHQRLGLFSCRDVLCFDEQSLIYYTSTCSVESRKGHHRDLSKYKQVRAHKSLAFGLHFTSLLPSAEKGTSVREGVRFVGRRMWFIPDAGAGRVGAPVVPPSDPVDGPLSFAHLKSCLILKCIRPCRPTTPLLLRRSWSCLNVHSFFHSHQPHWYGGRFINNRPRGRLAPFKSSVN